MRINMRKICKMSKIQKLQVICIALVPSATQAMIWNPCRQRALRHDSFCATHRDALDGAVLGLCAKASQKGAASK